MNVLNAIGNIGQDAVVRFTKDGNPIASFSFALQDGYGDSQITSWVNCSLFGKRAETLAPMLLKGTKIGITGSLRNAPYTSKDGSEKFSLECRLSDVTLLGKPSGESLSVPKTSSKTNEQEFAMGKTEQEFDEQIPF
jgi:single-strand DNA-binding protein